MRTLYRNGRFLTMDSHTPVVDALLVQDDRILAVGRDYELEGLLGPGDRRFDLQGRTVVPGLIDAHTHSAQFSFGLTETDPLLQPVCAPGLATSGCGWAPSSSLRTVHWVPRRPTCWSHTRGVRAIGERPRIHLKN